MLEKVGLPAQARTVRQEIQQSRRWQEESERHMRKAYTQKSKSQQKCEKDKNCDVNKPEGIETLSSDDVKALKAARLNPHQIKEDIVGKTNRAMYNLYKDKNGDISVAPLNLNKNSNFEPTGYNINNYR